MDGVTAIVVTRGDVDLEPILATLDGYDEVIVWNNAEKPTDSKTYGRWLATEQASNRIVYHQDDDVLFTEHDRLRDAYQPGVLVANMPSPWYERTGYDTADQVFVGAGAILDRDLHRRVFDAYLARWPFDDDFLTYCDCLIGQVIPHVRLDLGYTILEQATAANRICTQPGAETRKRLMMGRGMELRHDFEQDALAHPVHA